MPGNLAGCDGDAYRCDTACRRLQRGPRIQWRNREAACSRSERPGRPETCGAGFRGMVWRRRRAVRWINQSDISCFSPGVTPLFLNVAKEYRMHAVSPRRDILAAVTKTIVFLLANR